MSAFSFAISFLVDDGEHRVDRANHVGGALGARRRLRALPKQRLAPIAARVVEQAANGLEDKPSSRPITIGCKRVRSSSS
jgi:hypothetical protein